MDDRPNKSTVELIDFKVGDLVRIATDQVLIEEVALGSERKYVYGIVVEDPRKNSQINVFMPQVPVYIFKSKRVEFHWASYLTILSSIYKEG